MATSIATKRIMRLVVFLLGTVGVVFLVLLLARRSRTEGFQTAADCATFKSRCAPQTISGDFVYLCPDADTASDLLQCSPDLATTLQLNPAGTSNLGIRDAVCYLVPGGSYAPASKVGDVYYVCYQRPPQIVYDDTLGMTRYTDPTNEVDDDPNPGTMTVNLETACGTYQGAGLMIGTAMDKTYKNIDYVSSAMRSIQGAYGLVSTIIKSRCGGTINDDQRTACSSLSNFGTIQTDTTYSDLQGLYTALTGSYGNMKSFFTSDTTPKFNGLNCRSLPQSTISAIYRSG
jgi:hypothetical protein